MLVCLGCTENWDDDFVFNPSSPNDSPSGSRMLPRESVSSARSDWDAETDVDAGAVPVVEVAPARSKWSEKTPTKQRARAASGTEGNAMDVEVQQGEENENWDDDFEDPELISNPPPPPRLAYVTSGSDSDSEDFGMATSRERDKADAEDRTVTARSRPHAHANAQKHRTSRASNFQDSPPPPVPALPASVSNAHGVEPFPAAVFTAPGKEREKERKHELGIGLGTLPPSPPIHRERRRLRKKSRPSGLTDDAFLSDVSQRSSMALDPSHPPPHSPPPNLPQPPQETTSPRLLARIGSVKKWGVRRKRGSTEPSHLARPDSAASDFSNFSGAPSTSTGGTGPAEGRSGWFFRSGSGSTNASAGVDTRSMGAGADADVEEGEGSSSHSHDVPNAQLPSAMKKQPSTRSFVDPDATPTKAPAKRKPSRLFAGLATGPAYPSTFNSHPPVSIAPSGCSAAFGGTSQGMRHVSANSRLSGLSSMGRAASTTLVNASTDSLPSSYTADKKGSGRWARRLSLVSRTGSTGHSLEGKHRRGVSGGVLGAAFEEMQRERAGTPQSRLSAESKQEDRRSEGGLGPPISLHPPSPPQTVSPRATAPETPKSTISPQQVSEAREKLASPTSPTPTTATARLTRSPASAHSASLGRATIAPPPIASPSPLATHNEGVPRRNSLGDLKIPTRISQAQVSLRRDLGLVREFAGSVEQLKTLQTSYRTLFSSVQSVIDAIPLSVPPPSSSPPPVTNSSFFQLSRTGSTKKTRARSNTGPVREKEKERQRHHERERLRSALTVLEGKYRVSWECAELLIELGGGTPSPTSAAAPTPSSTVRAPSPLAEAIETATRTPLQSSTSDPAALAPPIERTETRKSRERAITLSGDEGRSLGRTDLSQRQLVILREMLDGSQSQTRRIPEESPMASPKVHVHVNRGWRWGDAMSSTITLPQSEDDTGKKRKKGMGMGLSGFRELLRAMKRQQASPVPPVPNVHPTTDSNIVSSASESSIGEGQAQRRRAKTSTGPESIRATQVYSPPPPPSHLIQRASPRRPSLASIFRLGQKSKPATSSDGAASSVDSISIGAEERQRASDRSSTEEEDWDRMDSASDLEHAAKALGPGDGLSTVKGKGRSPYLQGQPEPQQSSSNLRPVTPMMGPEASRSSMFGGADALIRPTRLSNVEENAHAYDDHRGSKALRKGKNRSSLPVPSLVRSKSRMALKSDSVRSAPPQSAELSEFKLAMTPENIKPLLENAREVHLRLEECIAELKVLLASATTS
ncbi:hypothetical protein HWV62_18486 [Athelia sp. TMB]|nr:hypothetical protein HWV62_18486 [Athelia sp. TMB]